MRRATRTRRGITLMEVLISTFVLSIGLLGLAALIPVGQFTLIETAKADRSGACGRAGLRDVDAERMLDWRLWVGNPPLARTDKTVGPFVIDPLGVNAGMPATFAGLGSFPRRTLMSAATLAVLTNIEVERIFRWHDDLVFKMPEDPTLRPVLDPLQPGLTDAGTYSWLLTVVPAKIQDDVMVADKTLYQISIVVCYRRDLDPGGAGEHLTSAAISPGGWGGGPVVLTDKQAIREDEWIMLCDANSQQCHWYRVVAAGESPTDQLQLMGPDWDTTGGSQADAVIVDNVVGVYTVTVDLEDDYSLWSRPVF